MSVYSSRSTSEPHIAWHPPPERMIAGSCAISTGETMKHRFLLTLMLLGLPSLLYSQTDTTGAAQENDATPGTWMIVASAGWTFPAAPPEFKDQFKINYNFGGGIAYSMSPGDVGYGEVSLLLHYYNTLFSRSGFRTPTTLPPGHRGSRA